MMKNIPLTYYGGKQSMLKHIMPLIPPHETYTESFAGGAAVYWAKTPATVEVLNDTNGNLVNFYIVLKTKFDELNEKVQASLHSRQQFDYASIVYDNPGFFDDVTRAWATWFKAKLSFASKMDTFGYNRTSINKVRNLTISKSSFTEELAKRLEYTQIENTDALRVIKSRDWEKAFHFVDPPYINAECGHYRNTFDVSDFQDLLELLSRIKGKFMLTMYPHDLIDCYVTEYSWTVTATEKTLSASLNPRRKRKELIITNYSTISNNL